ncbi:MAG: 4-hydroxythreonine-4-phosphate dehydrogenase [Helicobacteraceae bacterium]|jgi:4-hydroxythreonine-4-phosphate dehydrogenase|nr:4-hydroxythreonine-4-phosphate dehydrogenase [Helicobacteraceae bacterium]
MKKIAISIGDLNGVGFEIALLAHDFARSIAKPIYCIPREMALQSSKLLKRDLPKDFTCVDELRSFTIEAGTISADSGMASFESFVKALDLAEREALAVVTLPINKAAWQAAGLRYKGHTDYLRDRFGEGVMMLGCPKRYAVLYTDHIPLSNVAKMIRSEPLGDFLLRVAAMIPIEPIGVLGLNPHSGDHGAIGSEESAIESAIERANNLIKRRVFEGAIVPDIAFTPKALQRWRVIVAMYHDQALAPLKALFFDEAINVTLGLPFTRTSVDHGTAFDIAYKNANPSIQSYKNALFCAVNGIFNPRLTV